MLNSVLKKDESADAIIMDIVKTSNSSVILFDRILTNKTNKNEKDLSNNVAKETYSPTFIHYPLNREPAE